MQGEKHVTNRNFRLFKKSNIVDLVFSIHRFFSVTWIFLTYLICLIQWISLIYVLEAFIRLKNILSSFSVNVIQKQYLNFLLQEILIKSLVDLDLEVIDPQERYKVLKVWSMEHNFLMEASNENE